MVRQRTNTSRWPLRILLAKPGLDGHDVGIKVVAAGLRDAGFEVVFGGLYLAPEEVVSMAIQEGVDLIGLNVMSGSHMTAVPAVLKGLKTHNVRLPVIVGGIVPSADVETLKREGLAAYFGPGTPMKEIIAFLNGLVEQRREIHP